MVIASDTLGGNRLTRPSKKRGLLFFAVILSVCFGASLLGCREKPRLSGEILLYTSLPAANMQPIAAEFEKAEPNIKLTALSMGSGEIQARLWHEMEEGRIQADLLWVADFTISEELKALNLLYRYYSPEASQILGALKDKDGSYSAARLLDMIIAYNTDKVGERPKSYRDLLNPKYKGRIGIADPGYSGSAFYALATFAQSDLYGRQFIDGLFGNGLRVVKDNAALDQAIAKGDIWMGINLDYMTRARKVADSGARVDFVFPDGGVVQVPSPIAITQDSGDLEAAKAFVDFVLSKRGQKLMVSQGVVPVRLDVLPPSGIPSITRMRVLPSDPKRILAEKKNILLMFSERRKAMQAESGGQKG
jgi:iron(III) transport system substrate-binding protein